MAEVKSLTGSHPLTSNDTMRTIEWTDSGRKYQAAVLRRPLAVMFDLGEINGRRKRLITTTMTPDDARQLARALNEAAEAAVPG